MRPASEMSRDSTSIPVPRRKARTIGRNEYVARAGASSVRVHWMVEVSFFMGVLVLNLLKSRDYGPWAGIPAAIPGEGKSRLWHQDALDANAPGRPCLMGQVFEMRGKRRFPLSGRV